MDLVLTVLGLLLIIEGLPYFMFPEKVKNWYLFIQDLPRRWLRMMGLIAMIAGLLFVYIGRRIF